MRKYITLQKAVGETPLACLEVYRAQHPELTGMPMAYAGRLDPMASGTLLILVGDECKQQAQYHGLDKEYEFSVLFGLSSDSLDVLGRITDCPFSFTKEEDLGDAIRQATRSLVGAVSLPYPIFSAKTVQGKPLHTWTLEGKLNEIDIPTRESKIYNLEFINIVTIPRRVLVDQALTNINSTPPVTDPRKAIGNDFRRSEVRQDWLSIRENEKLPGTYTIAHFKCLASSGTYMRSLAKVVASHLNTCGLAWHIHRTNIGLYDAASQRWSKTY